MGAGAARMVGMADETVTTYEQLRDLDAEIESLADAIGAPGERSITRHLDTIERVLFALARAQGIAPDAAPCPSPVGYGAA